MSLGILSCEKFNEDLIVRDLIFGEADSLISTAKKFNAYNTNQRQNLFIEDFNNNDLNWPVVDGGMFHYRLIKNGVFYLMGSGGRDASNKNFPKINYEENYEIEIRFKINQTGSFPIIYSFTFAQSENSYDARIDIINDGENGNFNISNFIGNDYNRNRYFDRSVSYNSPSDYDKLTLRNVSGKWFVFMNEVFLYQIKSLPIATNYFRFFTNKEAQIDYIRFDYLINL